MSLTSIEIRHKTPVESAIDCRFKYTSYTYNIILKHLPDKFVGKFHVCTSNQCIKYEVEAVQTKQYGGIIGFSETINRITVRENFLPISNATLLSF